VNRGSIAYVTRNAVRTFRCTSVIEFERSDINLSGRVDELTDGTVCAVDAATGAGIGSIWDIPANDRMEA
jgi:hypothetical protein